MRHTTTRSWASCCRRRCQPGIPCRGELAPSFGGCHHSRECSGRTGCRLHDHARFNLTNAGSGIHTLADINHAYAAYAYRVLVLLVAEGWDRNAVDPGSVEDCGARRDRDGPAVDGELNLVGGFGAHAVPLCFCGKQTPAGQRRLVRCSSTTSRKCLSTERMGTGTTWPSPQIEVCFSACESSSSNGRSVLEERPSVHPVSISTSF